MRREREYVWHSYTYRILQPRRVPTSGIICRYSCAARTFFFVVVCCSRILFVYLFSTIWWRKKSSSSSTITKTTTTTSAQPFGVYETCAFAGSRARVHCSFAELAAIRTQNDMKMLCFIFVFSIHTRSFSVCLFSLFVVYYLMVVVFFPFLKK